MTDNERIAADAALQERLTSVALEVYPDTQAIYLFGSWGTDDARPDSDLDIALLLPPADAKHVDFWMWNELALRLGEIAGRNVDLLNARQVPTVLQKEIVMADRRIYCSNDYAADEFEMLTLSFYQKLNEERAGIIADGLQSGRFYRP